MSRRDYAITRREDTINYKVKDVEEADEEEVFDIGDDLEVDLSGLTDMEGIRQRIIMHIEKVKGNYKDQVWRSAANDNGWGTSVHVCNDTQMSPFL